MKKWDIKKIDRDIVILRRTAAALFVVVLILSVMLLICVGTQNAKSVPPSESAEGTGEVTYAGAEAAEGTEDTPETEVGEGDTGWNQPSATDAGEAHTERNEPSVTDALSCAETDDPPEMLETLSFESLPEQTEPPADTGEPSTEPPADTEADNQPGGIWQGAPPASQGLSFRLQEDGSCILTGMGSCTDTCLIIPTVSPEGWPVTAIAEKAFYGCGVLSAVYIPASVEKIGALAFAACPRLAYLSVEADNPTFRSVGGILYDKACTVLLCCPPARNDLSVTVPLTVQAIADMAFYGVTGQVRICYEGTWEAWQRVYIGYGNNVLSVGTVYCLGDEQRG